MRRQVLHHSFAGTSPDSTSLIKPGRRHPCMLVAAGAGASSRAETGAAVGCFCLCLAGDSRDAGHAGHRYPSAAGDRTSFAYLQITSFGGPSRRQNWVFVAQNMAGVLCGWALLHQHAACRAAGDRSWFDYLQITSFDGPSRRQKCFLLRRIWWGCCVGGRCCINMQHAGQRGQSSLQS